MAKVRGDNQTGDLLSWQPEKVTVGFETEAVRGNRLTSRIAQAVALALKECGKPRSVIAEEMSEELGYAVSEATLDAYASQAKESHRIPLERFMALVTVTRCHDLLGFVAEHYGFAVVPQEYADLIELHQLESKRAEIDARAQALRGKWRAGR
ncbi:hypothetical protein [Breoghania sp.]|uniref:hypothetical protein n=1 Tax=Breoghania sp. TaxID=2065378 RepID=UPI0029CA86A1|nr:hypothetical protein [Breoghania sp.]